jgi:hypothetical protein
LCSNIFSKSGRAEKRTAKSAKRFAIRSREGHFIG